MCEMCGVESHLFKADVEGSKLNVCTQCVKFGKVISRVRPESKNKKKVIVQKVEEPTKELIQVVTEDYSKRIRDAREKMGLKQIQLAKKLAERESIVQKLESNQFIPSIRLARKLENHLRIKLIEQHEEKHEKKFKAKGTALTIGDMIELKK